MKATIDFDDHLYRRLKIEAARRGRTIRDLVADGVRHVLDAAPEQRTDAVPAEWQPEWLGSLAQYAGNASDHSMSAVRASVGRARVAERGR